jgi:hypothetical protein
MSAYRYWRIAEINSCSKQGLELGAMFLMNSQTRVDGPATLSASVVPDVSGVLGALQDLPLTTRARWSAGAVKNLSIVWDFGSATPVSHFIFSSSTLALSLFTAILSGSSDGVTWEPVFFVNAVPFPGSDVISPEFQTNQPLFDIPHEGVNGGTVWADLSGGTVTRSGEVTTSTELFKFGSSSTKMPDTNSFLRVDISPSVGYVAKAPYSISVFVYPLSMPTGARQTAITVLTDRSGFTVDLGYSDNSIYIYSNYWGTLASVTNTGQIPVNQWSLLTLERVAGDLGYKAYVNGQQILFASSSTRDITDGKLTSVFLGGNDGGSEYVRGYIDESIGFQGEYFDQPRFGTQLTGPFSGAVPRFDLGKDALGGYVRPVGVSKQIMVAMPPIFGTPIPPKIPSKLLPEEGQVRDYLSGVLGKGRGRVRGTVKVTPNTPVYRKVRLIREHDGVVIREQFSHPVTGSYDFKFIDELQKWTVVSYDYEKLYRAVIADNLTPELMP